MSEVEALILLNLTYQIGMVKLKALRDEFGSAAKALSAGFAELKKVNNIGPITAQAVIEVNKSKSALLTKELKLIKKHNARVITYDDEDFPPRLKDIHDPPILLYLRGELKETDLNAVAIVGSRRASRYGIEQAERFGRELAAGGITIVSGLARGVDAASHRGALMARGRTITCLGSGLSRIYPPENRSLFEEIAVSGAGISEFPMCTEPKKEHFPRRNRIISGLSRAVLIVEAAQTSGALITADYALNQGKEVFCLPGRANSPTSQGTLKLIKEGAVMVTEPGEIMEGIGTEIASVAPSGPPRNDGLHAPGNDGGGSEIEKTIIDILKRDESSIEELLEETHLTAAELSTILTRLELKKQVKRLPGAVYSAA